MAIAFAVVLSSCGGKGDGKDGEKQVIEPANPPITYKVFENQPPLEGCVEIESVAASLVPATLEYEKKISATINIKKVKEISWPDSVDISSKKVDADHIQLLSEDGAVLAEAHFDDKSALWSIAEASVGSVSVVTGYTKAFHDFGKDDNGKTEAEALFSKIKYIRLVGAYAWYDVRSKLSWE